MLAFDAADVERQRVTEKDASGEIYIRWLLHKGVGAKRFAMRMFEVCPGAQAGPHSHDFEHEVFILEGTGLMTCGNDSAEMTPGRVAFIPPNEPHEMRNTGGSILRYLCLIPYVDG